MKSALKLGFTWTIDTVDASGTLIDSEVVHNLVPMEGINHFLNTTLKGGGQNATWYVGLYEGNYTPSSTDTAVAFPAAATETTAYDETTRPAFTSGAVSAGSLDNSASKAVFTFNAIKTVYGGFLTASPVKGGTSTVLISVVRFGSPKNLDPGAILRVTAGIAAASS